MSGFEIAGPLPRRCYPNHERLSGENQHIRASTQWRDADATLLINRASLPISVVEGIGPHIDGHWRGENLGAVVVGRQRRHRVAPRRGVGPNKGEWPPD